MTKLLISPETEQKLLEKHHVRKSEVLEAFANHADSRYIEDTRFEHVTTPPTYWFIANTDEERELKVAFIYFREDDVIVIKTAYTPNEDERRIYGSRGKK